MAAAPRCAALVLLLALLLAAAAGGAQAQGKVQGEMLSKVNDIRKQRGLKPLQYDRSMDGAAARHSTDMANKAMLSHSGSDGSRPADRLRVAGGGGFSAIAENVAMVPSSSGPSTVVDMWMGSQGHRDNMLNGRYTHVGVAQAQGGGRTYWTMVLGAGRRRR